MGQAKSGDKRPRGSTPQHRVETLGPARKRLFGTEANARQMGANVAPGFRNFVLGTISVGHAQARKRSLKRTSPVTGS